MSYIAIAVHVDHLIGCGDTGLSYMYLDVWNEPEDFPTIEPT